ncbi:MAG: tetratricopeptide repeat protein [Planctomycetota bacterium]
MSDLDDKANDARRLGMMIAESRSGQALAGAIPHLREAAELFAKEQRAVRQAECLLDLGRVHRRLAHHAEAAKAFADALALVEDEADLTQAISAASEAGMALIDRGTPDEALVMLRRAETLADKANDHLQLAQVRHDLACCHLARKDAAAAAQAAQAALATFSAFRKGPQRAACEEKLAAAAALAGDFVEAARRFAAAGTALMELARHADADEVFARWADEERDRGAFDAAQQIDRERIARHVASGNRGLEALAQLHLGLVLAKQQNHTQAMEAFRAALNLCERADDRAGQAKAQLHIGAGLVRVGDTEEGLRCLRVAAELASEAKDLRTEEEARSSIVRQLRSTGDVNGALTAMQQWIETLQRKGDYEHRIQVLGELAEVSRQTGDQNQAETALRELIAACTEKAHRAQLVDAHHHLGVLIARRGNVADGLDHLRRSLALLGSVPAHSLRAQLLYRIGNAELRLGKAPEALRSLQASLASNPDDKLRPRILVDLGNAQAQLGLDDEAAELFEQAAKIAEKQGDMRATVMIRKGAGGLKK